MINSFFFSSKFWVYDLNWIKYNVLLYSFENKYNTTLIYFEMQKSIELTCL